MGSWSDLSCELRPAAGGGQLLVPRVPLAPYPERFTDWLQQWAGRTPGQTLVAERVAGLAWRRLSYADTLRKVQELGAGLLSLPLSAERPLVILSGNSIEHLLTALAAMYVGIPYVPVSPAYSSVRGELSRLRGVLQLLTPGVVAVFGDGPWHEPVRIARELGAALLTDDVNRALPGAVRMADIAQPALTATAAAANQKVAADTVAKYMLTSGSTGMPKAVITTHRMLCSNQHMIHSSLPFVRSEPPLLVDWLPWNHVFGGSHNVGIAIANGGSLYIDGGRPTASGMAETVRNLCELSPTVYFNVPRGFDLLVPMLQSQADLRHSFFRDLKALMFAGAGLSEPTWLALEQLARAESGRELPILSGLGATETAPAVTFTTPAMGRAGAIGLPAPGNLVKLVPALGKTEIRVRGPNVTPGYWRAPELTRAAFDEEGFYKLGDAVRWQDPADPQRGLIFDGRVAEDFKLATGTWVSVGPLRASLLAALAPLVQDVVIAGLNRDQLAVLIFVDPAANRAQLVPELQQRLQLHAARAEGSATRIARALLLETSPSLDAGEITDKGTINQRAVLERRAAQVERLYADPPPPAVMVVG